MEKYSVKLGVTLFELQLKLKFYEDFSKCCTCTHISNINAAHIFEIKI